MLTNCSATQPFLRTAKELWRVTETLGRLSCSLRTLVNFHIYFALWSFGSWSLYWLGIWCTPPPFTLNRVCWLQKTQSKAQTSIEGHLLHLRSMQKPTETTRGNDHPRFWSLEHSHNRSGKGGLAFWPPSLSCGFWAFIQYANEVWVSTDLTECSSTHYINWHLHIN